MRAPITMYTKKRFFETFTLSLRQGHLRLASQSATWIARAAARARYARARRRSRGTLFASRAPRRRLRRCTRAASIWRHWSALAAADAIFAAVIEGDFSDTKHTKNYRVLSNTSTNLSN